MGNSTKGIQSQLARRRRRGESEEKHAKRIAGYETKSQKRKEALAKAKEEAAQAKPVAMVVVAPAKAELPEEPRRRESPPVERETIAPWMHVERNSSAADGHAIITTRIGAHRAWAADQSRQIALLYPKKSVVIAASETIDDFGGPAAGNDFSSHSTPIPSESLKNIDTITTPGAFTRVVTESLHEFRTTQSLVVSTGKIEAHGDPDKTTPVQPTHEAEVIQTLAPLRYASGLAWCREQAAEMLLVRSWLLRARVAVPLGVLVLRVGEHERALVAGLVGAIETSFPPSKVLADHDPVMRRFNHWLNYALSQPNTGTIAELVRVMANVPAGTPYQTIPGYETKQEIRQRFDATVIPEIARGRFVLLTEEEEKT